MFLKIFFGTVAGWNVFVFTYRKVKYTSLRYYCLGCQMVHWVGTRGQSMGIASDIKVAGKE